MRIHRLQYIGFITSLLLSSCVHQDVQQESTLKEKKILLYGEQHGVEPILNKEFELWSNLYHKKGYRDLFVELPYSAAELLNIWMKESDDNILEQLYQDWKGSLSHNRATVQFYQKIKKDCPATVFHGTDVGHQYNTTGVRFLKYLESKGLKDSEAYTRTLENIKQGKTYYQTWKRSPQEAEAMREQAMTENFLREVPKLNGAPIMGIYGVDHIKDAKQSGLETMASRLKVQQHGLALHTEDLSPYRLMTSPLRVETVTIGGKNYQASYFGQLSLKLRDYAFREFWRLENAYEDVKNLPLTGDVLPDDNYPTVVQKGQVFMILYTKHDGSTETKTYRSDGRLWQGLSTTEEFRFKDSH